MNEASSFHLDTSVVMRLLVGAPLDQFRQATRFLEERVAEGRTVTVEDLVFAEAYFALQSAYSMPKDEAIALLAQFSAAPGIAVSDHTREVLALPNLSRAKPGFGSGGPIPEEIFQAFHSHRFVLRC